MAQSGVEVLLCGWTEARQLVLNWGHEVSRDKFPYPLAPMVTAVWGYLCTHFNYLIVLFFFSFLIPIMGSSTQCMSKFHIQRDFLEDLAEVQVLIQ